MGLSAHLTLLCVYCFSIRSVCVYACRACRLWSVFLTTWTHICARGWAQVPAPSSLRLNRRHPGVELSRRVGHGDCQDWDGKGDAWAWSQRTYSADLFWSIYCLTRCQKQSDLQKLHPGRTKPGEKRPAAWNHRNKDSSSCFNSIPFFWERITFSYICFW